MSRTPSRKRSASDVDVTVRLLAPPYEAFEEQDPCVLLMGGMVLPPGSVIVVRVEELTPFTSLHWIGRFLSAAEPHAVILGGCKV